MRLMIVFVIALIVTCISTKDKDEGEFGLEIRLQVRPRPRQLLHYDIASIYTHQKNPLSLKFKKWLKITPDDPKRRKILHRYNEKTMYLPRVADAQWGINNPGGNRVKSKQLHNQYGQLSFIYQITIISLINSLKAKIHLNNWHYTLGQYSKFEFTLIGKGKWKK